MNPEGGGQKNGWQKDSSITGPATFSFFRLHSRVHGPWYLSIKSRAVEAAVLDGFEQV